LDFLEFSLVSRPYELAKQAIEHTGV
jgi:hypothetical protein